MSKKIHLGGDEDDFFQSLADRLSRAGATLVVSPDDADYVIHFGQEGDGNMVILKGGGAQVLCEQHAGTCALDIDTG